MGLLSAIQGNRLYLDTNIWIYALEGHPSFIQDLTELFRGIERGDLTGVTSELSLAETLVKPFQTQNLKQQQLYQQAINSRDHLWVIPIDRTILVEAARLRVSLNLKLPDAIHAATALSTQCSSFLTNDLRFQKIPNISIVILSQVRSKIGLEGAEQ